MIDIEYGIIKTKIYNIPLDILGLLESRFTFNYPNAYFIKKHMKNMAWDGKIRFYSKFLTKDKGTCFQIKTGLLHKALEIFDATDMKYGKYDHIDRGLVNNIGIAGLDMPLLQGINEYEEHQKIAFLKMLAMQRGILCSPTGSGKTEIALSLSKYLIDNVLNPGDCILFLTHRNVIFEDVWNERILGSEITYGRFKGIELIDRNDTIAMYRLNNCYIVTSMSQTFSSKLVNTSTDMYEKICERTRAVFVDEVHVTEAYKRKVTKEEKSKKVNILDHLVNCNIRWGLSATPFKDKTGYTYHNKVQDFGSVIKIDYKSPVKVIVERKPVKLIAQRNYDDAVANMERSESRNALISTMLLRNMDRKTLILTRHIEHGDLLSKITGLPFVQGETPTGERSQIIRDMKESKLKGIIASSVFYFGVDIPLIDLIILGSVGKSFINVVQLVGRGMRKYAGKSDLKVIDFTDEDDSYMEEHSKKRLSYYKQMGYEIVE